MSIHLASDPSLYRAGYKYDASGVGVRQDRVPEVNWNHVDGPLLYTSDAGLHWLTYWERFNLWSGLTTVAEINKTRLRR